jgi:predicted ester cyclase
MNDQAELRNFAQRYADAWCTHDPERVAAFYAKGASISVNDREPASIDEVAKSFIRDFPDMIVTFDKLEPRGDRTAFHWTLVGTYAGNGNKVRISGFELWKIDNDGLIAESKGNFDAADYEKQLRGN